MEHGKLLAAPLPGFRQQDFSRPLRSLEEAALQPSAERGFVLLLAQFPDRDSFLYHDHHPGPRFGDNETVPAREHPRTACCHPDDTDRQLAPPRHKRESGLHAEPGTPWPVRGNCRAPALRRRLHERTQHLQTATGGGPSHRKQTETSHHLGYVLTVPVFADGQHKRVIGAWTQQGKEVAMPEGKEESAFPRPDALEQPAFVAQPHAPRPVQRPHQQTSCQASRPALHPFL